MGGTEEDICARVLCDDNDPTRMTSKELIDGWGSVENFVLYHLLKPDNDKDLQEALEISRAVKEAQNDKQWRPRETSGCRLTKKQR